jgi:hypothetical protein
MLTITKLSAETQEFLNFIISGNRSRSQLASIVIGKALASTLNLPATPVDDIAEFYRLNVFIGLQTKVSDLNELSVIDVDAVLDYTARFYTTRYFAAYPKKTIFCPSQETAVLDFLGASYSLDQASMELIKASPLEVTKLYNGFVQFFDEAA